MGMMLKLGLKWFMEVVDASGFFVSAFYYVDVGEEDMAEVINQGHAS
jgi:hypothetical protein